MTFDVKSFIVCDDVRQETSGKQILIGVYLDSVVVRSVPVTIPQMAFRIVLNARHTHQGHATFSVKGDDGHTLLAASAADAHFPDPDEDAVFVFQIRNVVLPKAQRYRATFALNDATKDVGGFTLRLAKNDREAAALQGAS
jgi:uncharacterized protein DUF6941